jgi:hypothetical protein
LELRFFVQQLDLGLEDGFLILNVLSADRGAQEDTACEHPADKANARQALGPRLDAMQWGITHV